MSNPNEKAIERDFCAGVLTLEEVADKYGITVKALRYMAKKKGLTRTKGARKSKGKSGAKMGQKTGAKTSDNLPQKMPQNSASSTAKKAQKKSRKISTTEADDSVFDPDEFGISEQQALFAQFVAEGKSPSESYRLANYQAEGNSVHAAASRLLRNVKVSRAIRRLRDMRQKRMALTEEELIHQLSSIAAADPNELTQLRRVNCRYCWGEDHQYQWVDVDEYERACDLAVKNESTPPEFGGVGFVESALPNEECPRCFGEGKMQIFFADTTMLDGPARWLYAGVKETMNGLELKTASQEAARRELLKITQASKGRTPDGRIEDEADREWKQLRNDKLKAEIENITNGKKDSDLIVVHNALQVPGAIQHTQDEDDEGS